MRQRGRTIRICLLLALMTAGAPGCAFRAVNQPLAQVDTTRGYRVLDTSRFREQGRISVFLAFSGGGTRAAAFAYGVLSELRDTEIGSGVRLLDEVDALSGVSGGSFPAGYYGLFGDRIFDEFEERFLRRNVQGALIWRMLAPWNLVRLPGPNMSRTHIATEFYDKHVFDRATFADLAAARGPRIHINTTDLVQGNRFTLDQDTFDLICSDLDPLPVAAATAASSAVPGVLSPLTLRNYAGSCGFEPPDWFQEALKHRREDPRGARVAEEFASYLDSDERKYIHLVDGGVADNLGMTVFLERLAVAGDVETYRKTLGLEVPDHVIVIVVNAETEPDSSANLKALAPGVAATLGLMSGVQIHRANFETLDLTRRMVRTIGQELKKNGRPVGAHFIEVSFDLAATEEERHYLKRLPTSFRLSDEQVDRAISAGRELLRDSPPFQELLRQLR